MMHTLLDVVEFITIIIDVIVIPLSLVLALYLIGDAVRKRYHHLRNLCLLCLTSAFAPQLLRHMWTEFTSWTDVLLHAQISIARGPHNSRCAGRS
jgi:hypothetical protein